KAKAGVLLEGGHAAQQAVVLEMGKAPLDGLFHARAGLMKQGAKLCQNRLREGGRLGDIRIDLRGTCAHASCEAATARLNEQECNTGVDVLPVLRAAGSPHDAVLYSSQQRFATKGRARDQFPRLPNSSGSAKDAEMTTSVRQTSPPARGACPAWPRNTM